MQTFHEIVEIIHKGRPDVNRETAWKWATYLIQLNGCHLYAVSSPDIDIDKWKRDRKVGLGGSEIASVMGNSEWGSPRQVWLEKMGFFEDEPKPQSEQARWGNLLETIVATEWGTRENRKWIHIPVILQDDEKSYLLANIDGFILSADGKEITGILEIKTTSAYNEEVWKEGPLPLNYLCQTNWYCGITHLSNFVIVCLVGGQKLYHYELPADHTLFAQEVAVADTFWNENILKGVEPLATAQDKEMLDEIAPDLEKKALILDDAEFDKLAEAYCQVRDQAGKIKKVQDELNARIKVKLAGASQAVSQSHVVTLSAARRSNCDLSLLIHKYPEAYDECVSETVSYRMTVK